MSPAEDWFAAHAPQTATPSASGLLQAGTIDLATRPRVTNPDGSISTVRSLGVNIDGREVLIPTVVGNRVVSDEDAIAHYQKTGQHLGIFDSPQHATAYAQQLHRDQAQQIETPAAGDWFAANAPRQPDFKATSKPLSESVLDYGKEATAGFNPVTINKAIQSAFWHPIETAKGVLQAQDVPRHAAVQAFEKGDYVEGVGHLVNWLIPLLGPRLDEAGNYLRAGEIAKGLGATTDVALQVAAPVAAERVALTVKPRLVTSVNSAADAAAVAYGQARGVPIDAAAATGRPLVKNLQKSLEGTLGGSAPTRAAQLDQQVALKRVGGQLSEQVHPTPVQPVQAGEGVHGIGLRKISRREQRSPNWESSSPHAETVTLRSMSDETGFLLTAGAALLTAGVARELDCTPDGVRYLERTGRLHAVRVNGVRLFRRDEVVQLRHARQAQRDRLPADAEPRLHQKAEREALP